MRPRLHLHQLMMMIQKKMEQAMKPVQRWLLWIVLLASQTAWLGLAFRTQLPRTGVVEEMIHGEFTSRILITDEAK